MALTPGLGSVLKMLIVSTQTPLGAVEKISGVNMSVGSDETTVLGAAAKTFRPTMPDFGDITFTLQYNASDSTHAALIALVGAPVAKTFNLVMADAGNCLYAFSGFITAFNVSGFETETHVIADLTIKISGAITVTP